MPPIVDVQIPHVRHKTLILWSLGKFQRCCRRYSAICVRIDEKSKFYVSETQTFQISAVWARPNTGFSTLDCKSHEVCNRNKQKWYAKTQVHANFWQTLFTRKQKVWFSNVYAALLRIGPSPDLIRGGRRAFRHSSQWPHFFREPAME